LSLLLQTQGGRQVLEPRFCLDFDEKRDRAKERFAKVSEVIDESDASLPQEEMEELGHEETNADLPEDEEYIEDGGPLDGEEKQEDDDSPFMRAEAKECLRRLDLDYMHDDILPHLDAFHSKRFDEVMSKVLTRSAVSAILKIQLPKAILDYRSVPALPDPGLMLIPINEIALLQREEPDFKVEEGRERNSIKLQMDGFVYLVETILSFHSFLKYGSNLLLSRPGGSLEYDKALELFLRVLVSTVDRGEGTNQWNLQKTLELAHFKPDMLFMGSGSGFSTSTGERGLKAWAKKPSKTAQKRGDAIFSKQVCQRIHEAQIINAVAECKPLEEDDMEEAQITLEPMARCANFVVEVRNDSTSIHRILPSGRKHKTQLDFSERIISWFETTYHVPPGESVYIQMFTEVVLPRCNINEMKTIIRAHPNYRYEGPWYDYTFAKYNEDGREETEIVYPCKTVCFFVDPDSGETMALVQEVNHQTETQKQRDSQLFTHWTLRSRVNRTTKRHDAIFKALPVAVLSDRIYVIDPMPVGGFTRMASSDFDILAVKYCKEQWPRSYLESPGYLKKYRWN
jgi:hypothetical protein